MKITNLYYTCIDKLQNRKSLHDVLSQNLEFKLYLERANELAIDLDEIEKWMLSDTYKSKLPIIQVFINEVPSIVNRVESKLSCQLNSELIIGPSLKRIDGFARFDRGKHDVLIGPDHPRASLVYLKILLAHELSHVYRETRSTVWNQFGKSAHEISRQDYLQMFSLQEHLISEGLAVLFSEIIFPEELIKHYSFHSQSELDWCQNHLDLIGKAISGCSVDKPHDIWSFYSPNIVAPGSAPWPHYYWAGEQLRNWLKEYARMHEKSFADVVIEAHSWQSLQFECFLK